MENVEIKGNKKKTTTKKEKAKVAMREVEEEDTSKISKVEAKRSKVDAFLKSQINKMSKEQKETAIKFMMARNEARVKASMTPAYSQADIDLYK